MRLPVVIALACVLLAAGCGGGEGERTAPIEQVPAQGGLRERVAAAQKPVRSDFPSAKGKTLEELAAEVGGGDGGTALASSRFVSGRPNRVAFGTIGADGRFVYGKTAIYVAPRAGARARGPYPAPADVLLTAPAYRSKQAATESDPFAAVYAARVPLPRPGRLVILTVTRVGGKWVAGTGEITVVSPAQDPVPDLGERPPKVDTDTFDDAAGDVASIDTRQPPSDMHERSFADVLGSKPVVLLFATPQLCQSRVCGPVVDVTLQVRRRYASRVEFIHQEVYVDNDLNKGLREPLQRFHLPTEPWLFAVNREGRVTARLEGSFGLDAVEAAVRSAL